MGLSISSSSFGQRIEQALRNLSNQTSVVEDILIFSPTLELHKQHVIQVLTRCEKYGIQINKDKSTFAQQKVDYCGFRLTPSGYTVSPRLSNALSDFPRPQSKTDLRSLVGLINVWRDFDNSIATLMTPLTSIMSPKIDFFWSSAQEQAFVALKAKLTSPKVLSHFQPEQPLRLETDGSRKGLGFQLQQSDASGNWKLLQLGSRHVTDTEARYSVSELELLAVTWALEKTKYFCAGAPQLTLVTDHRPLVSIINHKSLGDLTTPRIQRLRERLYRYPSLVAVWQAGKKQVVSDCLSRFPVDKPDKSDLLAEYDLDESVHVLSIRNIRLVVAEVSDNNTEEDITKSIETSDLLLQRIKTACLHDSTYRKLHDMVLNNFPDHKSQLDDDLKPYWSCRDFLSTDGPVVLYKHRTLIPQELRKHIVDQLHASHSGESKTIMRAQQSVFWPGLLHQVKDKIRRCPECQRFKPANCSEPPLHNADFENPEAAGQFLSLDFFHLDQQEWLVISCNFSGWFNIYRMGKSASAHDLIRCIRDWISIMGVPIRIRSDGGKQMDSTAYKDFCEANYIRPSFSSPLVHCTTAEAAVRSAKNILRKTRFNSPEFFSALLEYRSSPRFPTKQSPNSLVFKRLPRTLIPVVNLDHSTSNDRVESPASKRHLAESLADTYARHKDAKPPLQVGQAVLVYDNVSKEWSKRGTVLKQQPNRRSYLLDMGNNSRLWRNRKLLQPVPTADVASNDEMTPPMTPATPIPPRRSTRHRRKPQRLSN